MTARKSSIFLFDDVRVENATFQAFKAGQLIQLEPKALKLLLFLIENRDRLIEKEEILNTIWSGTFVTDNALTREIGKLRKILGDDPKAPKYIQTVHTRGYRFIAELKEAKGQAISVPAEIVNPKSEMPSEIIRAPAPAPVVTLPLHPAVNAANRIRFNWAIATVITIAIILLSAIVVRKRQSAITSPAPPTVAISVAVLPFKTSDPTEEYLGFEIADALVVRLNNSTKLAVSPITGLRYSEISHDPRMIGSLMKVDYVLHGKIDRAGHHLSIQLIRLRDGVALLDESYDEKFDDIFKLEDSLCAKVLNSLLVTLDHEETQGRQRRYTENQEAYETFLKAHFFMNKLTPADIDKSIHYFRQAIELDPKYAMAYAGLSDSYMRLGRSGQAPSEFIPKSRAAVMKALELDETVAYGHSMLGRIAYQYDWDFPRAEREYRRARELQPKLVHAWYGFFLMTQNRLAEAETELQKFEAFLPFVGASSMSQYLYFTGQYDRAVDLLNLKLETNPDSSGLLEMLGLVYEQQGRTNESIAEFQKAMTLSQGIDGLGALGHLYAISGKVDEAEITLRKLDALSRRRYLSPYHKAVIYAGLGKKDIALKLLQKAYGERSLSPVSLRFDPRLNALRGDPQFQEFMRRARLPL